MALFTAEQNFFQLHHIQKLKNQRATSKWLKYYLSFTSLIAPGTFKKSNTLFLQITSTKKKKLFLKQSYLLLTWLAYLTNKTNKQPAIGQTTPTSKIDLSKPRISFKPTQQTIFTLTKAPMAQKTFSQEQFLFKFYKFTIRFAVPTPFYLTLNQSLYILL
jgi:ribosomal protein S10